MAKRKTIKFRDLQRAQRAAHQAGQIAPTNVAEVEAQRPAAGGAGAILGPTPPTWQPPVPMKPPPDVAVPLPPDVAVPPTPGTLPTGLQALSEFGPDENLVGTQINPVTGERLGRVQEGTQRLFGALEGGPNLT